jgi:hypothetical protein
MIVPHLPPHGTANCDLRNSFCRPCEDSNRVGSAAKCTFGMSGTSTPRQLDDYLPAVAWRVEVESGKWKRGPVNARSCNVGTALEVGKCNPSQ